MKTKEQIRKETPLSVTSTDNAIYEFQSVEENKFKIYDMFEDEHGHRSNYWSLLYVTLFPGDRLRLIQCFDDDQPNHYRLGKENQFIIVPDAYMNYISGIVDFRKPIEDTIYDSEQYEKSIRTAKDIIDGYRDDGMDID